MENPPVPSVTEPQMEGVVGTNPDQRFWREKGFWCWLGLILGLSLLLFNGFASSAQNQNQKNLDSTKLESNLEALIEKSPIVASKPDRPAIEKILKEAEAATLVSDRSKPTVNPEQPGVDEETEGSSDDIFLEFSAYWVLDRPFSPAMIAEMSKSGATGAEVMLLLNSRPLSRAALPRLDIYDKTRTFSEKYVLARAIDFNQGDRKFAQTHLLASSHTAVDENSHAAEITAAVVLGAIAFIGFFAVVIFIIGKVTDALPAFENPIQPLVSEEAASLAGRCFQFIMCFLLASVAVQLVARDLFGSHNHFGLIPEGVAEILIVLAALLVTRLPILNFNWNLKSYGLTLSDFRRTVLWGLGGYFAAFFAVMVCTAVMARIGSGIPTQEHPLIKQLTGGKFSDIGTLFALVSAALLAPIYEELLFRGTLIPVFEWLLRNSKTGGLIVTSTGVVLLLLTLDHSPGNLGDIAGAVIGLLCLQYVGKQRYKLLPLVNRSVAITLAIIISSLIFGAIHPTGVESWIPLASVGVVNGILVYQTRSIWPAIITHGLFNGVNLVLVIFLQLHGESPAYWSLLDPLVHGQIR